MIRVPSVTINGGEKMVTSVSRITRALEYFSKMDQVEGWLHTTTALAIFEIALFQESNGVMGDLAEIGIHHGKSFLVLAAAARPSETVNAIDVFEKHDLNIDNSGWGNREIFVSNVKRFFPGVKLSIIADSSLNVRHNEKELGLCGIRFLSIDGGHTKAITSNDLSIANNCLGEAGVCCLDDLFNPHWTGVISGLCEFLGTDLKPRLSPFALFPNKLFLCRPEYRDTYASYLRTAMDYALERTDLELLNTRIDVYGDRWHHDMHGHSLRDGSVLSVFQKLIGVGAAREQRQEALERLNALLEKLKSVELDMSTKEAQLRDINRNISFKTGGRPFRLAGRLLFHSSGKPRKLFRIMVLRG